MKEQTVRICVAVLLISVITAVIASGVVVTVSGVVAAVAWVAVVAAIVLCVILLLKAKKRLLAVLLILSLLINLCIAGVGRLREDSRKVCKEYSDGNRYHVLYYLNAGAMTSGSYLQQRYDVLIDSPVLTIMLLEEERHFKHLEGFAGFGE